MATSVAMTTVKMARIGKLRGGFQVVERDIPEPGTRHVRIPKSRNNRKFL